MALKYAPQLLKVKAVDRENYKIRFVFSTAALDRYDEIVDQSGWKLDNYLKNPVVLWGHDMSKFPIGRTENMSNQGQLEGDVIFAYNENPDAATAFELCAGGFLNAGSVGFQNLKWMYDEVSDVLTFLENELFEFSIVNVPANPEALTKALDKMKEKGVDKRVLDTVEKMRKDAETRSADRFESLGEEIKTEEKQTQEQPGVHIEERDQKIDAIVAAAEAVETLSRCESGTIAAAVKMLMEGRDVAQSGQTRSVVKVAPKNLSILKVNRLIRNLSKGKK